MQVEILMNHPIMAEFSFNKVLMSEITKSLEQKIYLPDDYIINKVFSLIKFNFKNDHGRDAYFIMEGLVNMHSPNEKEILLVLQAGDFFGEFGIYTTTVRVCPFIASSFCIIYVLNKDKLRAILKTFPNSDFDFLLYGKKK